MRGRDHMCDLDIDRRIILKWIWNSKGVRTVPNGKASEHGNIHLDPTQGGEFPGKLTECMISGFHHKADENCALLRCFTASSGNSLLTYGFLVSWPLKMRPIGCPKPSVWNYQYVLCNSPGECSSQAKRLLTDQKELALMKLVNKNTTKCCNINPALYFGGPRFESQPRCQLPC
jgi:hypothetical protein